VVNARREKHEELEKLILTMKKKNMKHFKKSRKKLKRQIEVEQKSIMVE
jgi:hypothetical protein